MKHAVMSNSLGSWYKLVGVIPISQQVGGLLVVNTDVVVLKHTGEEVINLPRYIQDVLNPEWESDRNSNIFKMMVNDLILHGFTDFSTACPVSPPPYPLFCNSSKLDAFHSDPCRKQKQKSD